MPSQKIQYALAIVLISLLTLFNFSFLQKNSLWAQDVSTKIATSHLKGESAFNYLKLKTENKKDDISFKSKIFLAIQSLSLFTLLTFIFFYTKKIFLIPLYYFFYFINIDFITRITLSPFLGEHIAITLYLLLLSSIYLYFKKRSKFFLVLSSLLCSLVLISWIKGFQLILITYLVLILVNIKKSHRAIFKTITNTTIASFILAALISFSSLQESFYQVLSNERLFIFLRKINPNNFPLSINNFAYLFESGFFILVIYHWFKIFDEKIKIPTEQKIVIFIAYILLVMSFFSQNYLIVSIPLCLFVVFFELEKLKVSKKLISIMSLAILVLFFFNSRKFFRLKANDKSISANQEILYIRDILRNSKENILVTEREHSATFELLSSATSLINSYQINNTNQLFFHDNYNIYGKTSPEKIYTLLKKYKASHILINKNLCQIFDYKVYPVTAKSRFCNLSLSTSPFFKTLLTTKNFSLLKIKRQ